MIADCRKGFTLITLLITVAITLSIAMALMISIRMIGHYMPLLHVANILKNKNVRKKIEWTEVERKWVKLSMKRSNEPVPRIDKLPLEQTLRFVAEAGEGGDMGRGEVEFIVNPAGYVRGNWSGVFENEDKNINYDIMLAEFEGFADQDEIYKDENGEDPDKLFIIAKGDFSIIEKFPGKNKTIHVVGDIFITGWLQKDGSAQGELHLISKERYYWVYNWVSQKGDILQDELE